MFRWSVLCFLISVALATETQKTVEEGNVMCPDKQGSCPSGTTCCKMASGKYGCCPLPNAVCCSDNQHCCPAKTTCDLVHQMCTPSVDSMFVASIPMFSKVPALPANDGDVVCPGGTTSCPADSTCCLLKSGDFGCCPLKKAVCCDDQEHCCPNGYTCDASAGTCTKQLDSDTAAKPMLPKTTARYVMCADQKSTCEDGQTCCQTAAGDYACCPLPKAVCCDDHLHCCPEGSECDVKSGQCLRGNSVTSWVAKQPSVAKQPVAAEYQCPDKVSTCPQGTTCCEMLNGHYGCCPMDNAVCCEDKLHCCAQGQTCNTKTGECEDSLTARLPWQKKIPAAKKVASVVCPDGVSSCPDGTTCCKLATGQYGCCPLPRAVCCSDGLHCCPNGYKCDAASCTKDDNSHSIPMLKKFPATVGVNDVQCQDKATSCPDNTTCCEMSTGGYGCCPFPKATCCSDKQHCCPNGYECDLTTSTCSLSRDASVISASPVVAKTESNDVKCSDESSCPDGTTCCKMPTGQYGCCPFVKATCCSDGLHCCPQGMSCDLATQTCKSSENSLAISWTTVKRQSSFFSQRIKAKVVNCPDGTQCPNGNTCCSVESGKFGCCPYPKAQCCSDHIHCCPSGYECRTEQGACVKQGSSLVLDWTMHTHSMAVKSEGSNDIQCQDPTVRCPDGSTCCKLVTGQYGCCPLPNAVCCSDGQHCCPEGTTCDVASGKCNTKDSLVSIPWSVKTEALKNDIEAEAPEDGTCQGAKFHCPAGRTCCRMSRGAWGCCAFSRAQCCSDGKHCCPHGYTCDIKRGSCLKGGESKMFLAAISKL